MIRALLLLLTLALAAPAAAQPEWRQARDVELRLGPNDISPGRVRLRAGEPVRLRVINNTLGAYRLRAPALFQTAEMRRRDREASRDGIAIAPGETRELLLVPRAGRYVLASTSLVRRVLGMRTLVVVD